MRSADKPACKVVVVTDLGTLSLIFYELETANVAPSGIIILLLLAALRRFIARFILRIVTIFASNTISLLRNSARAFFVTFITVRWSKLYKLDVQMAAKAHTVLLGVGSVLDLAPRRLKDGLEVRIYNKRCFTIILVLV